MGRQHRVTGVADIAAEFERAGAAFVVPPGELAYKLMQVRAFVFDWDGVFNRGEKSATAASGFTEADSMGINMLRFGYWTRSGQIPIAAIVTGEVNPSAEQFAARERFHWFFQGVRDKRQAIAAICERDGISADEVACVFDDINDLSMAGSCGVRFLVRRPASVLLAGHAIASRVCDYVTANGSGDYAIRETAELILGLLGVFEPVVESRVANDARYRAYFSQRQAVALQKATICDGVAVDEAR